MNLKKRGVLIMAKAKFTVTQSWVQVAVGECAITIEQVGDGAIYFDEASNDVTAYKTVAPAIEDQFQQTDAVPTFVRATGDGWAVIVDGVLV